MVRWMRGKTWVLAVGLVACGGADTPEPETDGPPVEEPPPPPPEPEPEVKLPSPDELYAMCVDRVEKPQADAECTSDADCAKGGCGGEVCTTKEAVDGLTTTCEDKLCFKVLDTCGCVEGVCSWSLLDELPENALPVERPDGTKPKGSLPPTDGKEGKKKRGRKKQGEPG